MSDAATTSRAARRELYEIIRGDAPFERKAREALELGAGYLGADNGYLTRIDPETDHWEAMVSTDGADGPVPAGLELDLGTTYCSRTVESDGQIALHDAPNQGWGDDVAFATYGLNCYLGTTLVVDGERYGTVCFAASEPREEPFSDDETTFAELVARLLERELERDRHEAELTKQANLATVLNRVLRHNLRNDLSVVRGVTQMMAESLGEADPSGAVALETIDDLLELSEKARELDEVVAGEFEREPTDVGAVVDRVVERVRERYPDATVAVDHEEAVTAAVAPSFERALEELVDNAAKHGGETVEVAVDLVPNAFTVRVADDGPGLAAEEIEVLETGAETPLTHGSGLGLWLAHWIVSNHDGAIDATTTGEGTTMIVSVPRKPGTDVQRQLSKLARARDQYKAAFEGANDAMVIADDDARIVDANPAAAELFGLDRPALLGRTVAEFLPEGFDFEAVWREFRETGAERDTITAVDADGVEHPVEYAGKADIVPGLHLFVSRDVTERVEREAELRATTERLEAVIAVSPDPIVALDADGRVELWNGAAEDVFGIPAEAAVGEPITSLGIHDPDQGETLERRLQRALDGEPLRNVGLRRRTSDGDPLLLSLSTAPLRDGSGTVTGIVGVVTDVTDLVETDAPR